MFLSTLSFCPTNNFPETSCFKSNSSNMAFTEYLKDKEFTSVHKIQFTDLINFYHPSVNSMLKLSVAFDGSISGSASHFNCIDAMQSIKGEEGGASPSRILFKADL